MIINYSETNDGVLILVNFQNGTSIEKFLSTPQTPDYIPAFTDNSIVLIIDN